MYNEDNLQTHSSRAAIRLLIGMMFLRRRNLLCLESIIEREASDAEF